MCHVYPNSLYTVCTCPRHRARRSRIRKAAEAGLLRTPTVEDAWSAVATMLDRGMSYRQISTAAGINHASFTSRAGEWKRGNPRRLQPLTRLALVTAEAATRQTRPAMVAAAGSTRRLRALAWMGWPIPVIADRTGIHKQTLQMLRSGEYANVSSRIADLLANLYAEISDVDGGDYRARARARNAGFPPPIAWDDDTIDDPDAQPGTDLVRLRSAAAGRILRYIDAHRIGLSLDEIATADGISPDAVLRHLERHGRHSLARALNATRAHDVNAHGRKSA